MSITGKILLNTETAHIFTGQDINLKIEIEIQEKVFVKEIFLNFIGVINTEWEEVINISKHGIVIYVTKTFKGQDICVNKHIALLFMDQVHEGKHTNELVLHIPEQLPESVKRKHGSVRYDLELGVNLSSGIQILHKMEVDIKKFLNICTLGNYKRPRQLNFKKSVCWAICNTRPLRIAVVLPTTTFIPGDSVKYFLIFQATNQFLELKRFSVILVQTQYYKALEPKEHEKLDHTTVKLMMHHFNRSNCKNQLEGSLKLPDSLEPSSQGSVLLKTSYKIQFILAFRGLHTDGYISIPIIVGSHEVEMGHIGDYSLDKINIQLQEDKKLECEV